MSLTRSAVLELISQSLLGTADLFVNKDDAQAEIRHYNSMLDFALNHLKQLLPRTQYGNITLVAGQMVYDGPADMWAFKLHTWGQKDNQPAPWDPGYITRLPVVSSTDNQLFFSFAPTAQQIATLGSRFDYFYFAHYQLNDQTSTVPVTALPLVITLAMAGAMQLLMVRGASNPVAVKPGVGRIAKAAPAEVFDMLMASAKKQAAAL